MTSEFHGDRPITVVDEDRFGLADIALRLSLALVEQSASKGFVLGIEGAWGSGKSSLLALTMCHLRSSEPAVEIVEFRPWLVGDRDQLLAALFEDLTKAIAAAERANGDATRATTIAAGGIAERARRYARHLGSAGKLASLAGMAVPGLGVVGAAMEKAAEAAAVEVAGPTLAAQKDELANALEALGRRIVVAVDDVDRLEPKEVGELLRLVRSVADFPNVTYVLCYDGGTLAASIRTATGVLDGRAYLEKIVQTEISVPRPESFALRALFSAELSTFADCGGEVGRRLMQVIDMAGGRAFDTPRTVMRVLDSIRLFWRGRDGRVDLADLVWLRIVAVTTPHVYRWVEEYLDALAVIATGKGFVSARERADVAKRLDAALGADGTDWERLMPELQLVLPAMGWVVPKPGEEDQRIFAEHSAPAVAAAADRRLASPDHSRLFFTLARAPGTVDLADIEVLLAAAGTSEVQTDIVLSGMAEERNVSGATKAERMLDQLKNVPAERLRATDLRNLAFAVASVAERIAAGHGEEWGSPRSWRLAKGVLVAIGSAAGERWPRILAELFRDSPRFAFLTHLLRDDTFDLGIHGGRVDRSRAMTNADEFAIMRDAMFERYRRAGIADLIGRERPGSMLYAWSQAGGRDEVVAAIDDFVEDDDERLVQVLVAVAGRSRDGDGRIGALDPQGLYCFFDDVPAVIEKVIALAAADVDGAGTVLLAIKASLDFHNSSIEAWIDSARAVAAAPSIGV